nr:hypothetical protein TQ38_28300 [Novosphingobium sp. P6W]
MLGCALGGAPAAGSAPAAVAQRDGSVRVAMRDFVTRVYTDRNPVVAYDRYAAKSLLDPTTGRSTERATAAAMVERFVHMPGSVFDVKNLLVDGDLAVVHYYGAFDPKKPGADVAEFFRWKNGRIVEHWAILQVRQDTKSAVP